MQSLSEKIQSSIKEHLPEAVAGEMKALLSKPKKTKGSLRFTNNTMSITRRRLSSILTKSILSKEKRKY